MPDLEMLLREVRPVPEAAWTARLDARVAARFPGPPPRWQAPWIAIRDHLLAIGAVATVTSVLIVIAIAAPSFNSGDSETGAGMAKPAGEDSTSNSSGASGSSAKVPAPLAVAPVAPARRDPAVKSTT